MLKKVVHISGVVTYQSPLLSATGVAHAFSTRIGGVSPAPYDTLNFGNPGDAQNPDPQTHIDENFVRLQNAINVPHAQRAWVKQVHSDRVEVVEYEPFLGENRNAFLKNHFAGQRQADALVTQEPDTLLAIRVADCVPILLADESGKLVAAAHAGWRGVVSGVLKRTVRTMLELDAKASGICAAIGPCISAEHFEVGTEVAEAFARADLAPAIIEQPGRKPHIDLVRALVMQLESLGVTRIDTTDRCSVRDAQEFFSHRRNKGNTGRMVAVVAAAK